MVKYNNFHSLTVWCDTAVACSIPTINTFKASPLLQTALTAANLDKALLSCSPGAPGLQSVWRGRTRLPGTSGPLHKPCTHLDHASPRCLRGLLLRIPQSLCCDTTLSTRPFLKTPLKIAPPPPAIPLPYLLSCSHLLPLFNQFSLFPPLICNPHWDSVCPSGLLHPQNLPYCLAHSGNSGNIF